MTEPTPISPGKRIRRWFIVAAGVGLGLIVVIVTRSLTQRPRQAKQDESLASVQAFMAKGDYQAAARSVDEWLSAEPKSADASYWRVRVDVALDRVKEIEPDFQRAKALGNSAERLEFLRALVAAKMKKYTEAEPPLRRAFLRNEGPDPQLDEALARVYLENFNIPSALVVLTRWAKDQPGNASPYLWKAEVDSRSDGQLEALETDYREALKRDPDLAKARLGLAEILRKAHRDPEARVEYQAYLARNPDEPNAQLGAGRVARAMGDAEAAERHFRRTLELDPKNAEARKEYADSALGRNDASKALEQIDAAIAIDAFEPNYHYTRSLALKKLGRDDEAKAEQATTARLRAELDHLTNLRRQLVQHPDNVSLQVEITRWMFEHGQTQGGVDWAEKILRQHPNQEDANRLLATHYEKAGNAALANFYRLRAENPSP